MSILSDLLNKKITFSQAASEATSWASALITHDTTLTNTASAALSVVKQAASDAITAGDTAVGKAMGPIVTDIETGLETALAALTRGASVPLNPFIDDGIEAMAALAKNAIDAWALETKAKLAAPSK